MSGVKPETLINEVPPTVKSAADWPAYNARDCT